jgi:hypothetical protein
MKSHNLDNHRRKFYSFKSHISIDHTYFYYNDQNIGPCMKCHAINVDEVNFIDI